MSNTRLCAGRCGKPARPERKFCSRECRRRPLEELYARVRVHVLNGWGPTQIMEVEARSWRSLTSAIRVVRERLQAEGVEVPQLMCHEKVTYVCDRPGCGNQHTVTRRAYDRCDSHYCGRACFHADRPRLNKLKRQACTNITFTCDRPGCGRQRTVTRLIYGRSEKHYCGTACFHADRPRLTQLRRLVCSNVLPTIFRESADAR